MNKPTKQDCQFAALAAGYEFQWVGPDDKGTAWINGDYMSIHSTRPWEPLIRDDHSFRLMVDMANEMDSEISREAKLRFNKHRVGCSAFSIEDYICSVIKYADNKDKHAATRQAIFDCAISIGKSK